MKAATEEQHEALLNVLDYPSFCQVRIDGDEVWIEFGEMYKPGKQPDFSALVEFFGAESEYHEWHSERGCETCDYGSLYGWNVTVRGATKNLANYPTRNSR